MARYFPWMLVLTGLLLALVSGCGGGDNGNQSQSLAVQLSASPQSGTTSNLFTFHAETTNAAGMQYRWDWDGDGTFDTPFRTMADAEYIYADPGTYHPEVMVTDNAGQAVTAGTTVTVAQETNPIKVTLYVGPLQGTTQTEFNFHATAFEDLGHLTTRDQLINSGYVRWDWEDDGIFDTPFTPFQFDVLPPENNVMPDGTHRFATPGTYRVRVQIKRDDRIGADTVEVVVNP